MGEREQEREDWNRRYGQGEHLEREPSSFLIDTYKDFVGPCFPGAGRALDVAGGTGRHAVWLAERGWEVTLVDISNVGVEIALQEARTVGVKIHAKATDLRSYDFGRARFELILAFYFLQREFFPRLAAALKPGGFVLYKTYTREHRKFRGCSHPMYFLEPGELHEAFPELRTLHYAENEGVAQLVAKRPDDL